MIIYIYVCVCVCVCVTVSLSVCVCLYAEQWENCRLKNAKNENTADKSFYQIYLPKLNEKFLQYLRSNLFEEITIGFNHSIKRDSESLANLSDCVFFKMVNAAAILALKSVLMPHWQLSRII